MVILKKIGVLSLAKLSAIVSAIMGLIMGTIYACLAPFINSAEGMTESLIQFGWWTIIVFPILYGIMGFVGGIIGAGLYNLVSKWVGGIKLELVK